MGMEEVGQIGKQLRRGEMALCLEGHTLNQGERLMELGKEPEGLQFSGHVNPPKIGVCLLHVVPAHPQKKEQYEVWDWKRFVYTLLPTYTKNPTTATRVDANYFAFELCACYRSTFALMSNNNHKHCIF